MFSVIVLTGALSDQRDEPRGQRARTPEIFSEWRTVVTLALRADAHPPAPEPQPTPPDVSVMKWHWYR